jgi:hypothetical protein
LTPSLFDLPVSPSECAKLAVLVLEQAAEKPLTDEVRARIGARLPLVKLEGIKPWVGSLERDPIHPSAIYLAVDAQISDGPETSLLLRIAPNATPSSGLFPNSILIGRMPGPKGIELVVNAIPFAHTDATPIRTFIEKVNRAFQPRPAGARSAILVETSSPQAVLPAAFEAFREILRTRSLNLAGAADAQTAAWSAIRTGWREGYITEAKDFIPAAQLTERQRAIVIIEVERASEAAEKIEQCSQFLY